MSSTLEYPPAPPEIWSLILSSLRPHSLAQIAQVSSFFRSLSLPLLYRAVRLRSDSEAIKATFELLKYAHYLRENIRDLHITSPWKDYGMQPNIWLNLDILAFLPGLRVLTLAGLPYNTAKENITFVSALSTSCCSLEELVLLEDPSVDGAVDETCELEWPVSHPLYFTEIFSKCRTSITRLTMVLLSGGDSVMTSLPFSISHFPHLTSLKLGPCLDYPNDDGGRILTQFLIAHPVLENLTLDFSAENTMMIELCESTMTSDMLPRLRSLNASIVNILHMIRSGVRSLQTQLSKLHVRYDQTMVGEATEMLCALAKIGGLPMLDELYYDLDIQHDFEEHRLCKLAMLHTGKICPGLRRFTDSVSDNIEVDNVADIFCYFPKVTHLSFPLLRGTKEDHHNLASALASTCHGLVEILFGLDDVSYMKFWVRNGSVLSASIISGRIGF